MVITQELCVKYFERYNNGGPNSYMRLLDIKHIPEYLVSVSRQSRQEIYITKNNSICHPPL